MAQPQVVNIQAMYEIGKAMHWQPDNRPTFMPWLQGIMGKFAVDMMYDTYETWREDRKANRNLYSKATTMKGSGNQVNESWLQDLDHNYLYQKKKEIDKHVNKHSLSLSGKNKQKHQKAINEGGVVIQNYTLNRTAYLENRASAGEVIHDGSSDFAMHNSSESNNFTTQYASRKLDKLVSVTDSGDWYLSADKVQVYMNEIKEQLISMQTMEGEYDEVTLQSDAFKNINKELRIYDNILNHSMNGKDLYVKDFNIAMKNESNIVLNHFQDRTSKGIYKKMANNSSDGNFPESDSRRFVASILKGNLDRDDDGSLTDWKNKIQSTWFVDIHKRDNADGVSPAHEYLTKGVDGKISLAGQTMEVIQDPYELKTDPDTDGDGIGQVMEQYLGAMEMLKKEDLSGGAYGKYLEDFFVDVERQEFQYHQDQEVEKQNKK